MMGPMLIGTLYPDEKKCSSLGLGLGSLRKRHTTPCSRVSGACDSEEKNVNLGEQRVSYNQKRNIVGACAHLIGWSWHR